MARGKKKTAVLSPEQRLQQALVSVEEQPYKVPENWCWTYVGAISILVGGGTPNKSNPKYWNGDIPWASVKDVKGDYLYTTLDSITHEGLENSAANLCDVDDLILVTRIEPAKTIVATIVSAINQDLKILKSPLSSVFLHYYFKNFRHWFEMKSSGSTVKGITVANIQNTHFPLPPLPEQQRIVDRIESLFAKLDEAKEKVQAVVDGFEDRKAAILHKAFTGELTAKWRVKNNVNNVHWKKLWFDECVDKMQNGISKRKGDIGEPYVVLRLANLSDEDFDENDLREILLDEKERNNYQLKSDDVLMIRVNGSKENVGKLYRITNQKQWAFCDHIIRIRYTSNIMPQYMVFFSKTKIYRQYIKDNMVSSAGQNTISRKGMAKLRIPIPKKDEQEQIVAILENIFEKEQQAKEAAEQVIDQIDVMKKSILARAFRGDLGTNDPNDESAVEFLKSVL